MHEGAIKGGSRHTERLVRRVTNVSATRMPVPLLSHDLAIMMDESIGSNLVDTSTESGWIG